MDFVSQLLTVTAVHSINGRPQELGGKVFEEPGHLAPKESTINAVQGSIHLISIIGEGWQICPDQNAFSHQTVAQNRFDFIN